MTKREQLLQTIASVLGCTEKSECPGCELSQKVYLGSERMALCTALEALQANLMYFNEKGE